MKLALGTVQFGLPYGITNRANARVSDGQIEKILSYAYSKGIHTLDTASEYGVSETILGKIIETQPSLEFSIITKTPRIQEKKILPRHVVLVEEKFAQSCSNLQQNHLYGLMVHDSADLLADGGDRIVEKLLSLKAQKKIKKWGCSFYNPEDLFSVLEKFDLDIVQLPLNLFDQRFVQEGALAYLEAKKIEIYARSVFLQGLLLTHAQKLSSINMSRAQPYMNHLDEICSENGISRLALIIAFMRQFSNCQFVMGFNGVFELEEVFEQIEKMDVGKKIDFSSLSVSDLQIINPTFWKNKNQ
ncbi:MAG: hypothetical protein COY58_02080 [Gammaproteobacteria bacterium CG_4_10_14_0_8_um_filter_38_16]|nr:MAG: hypothetical protein COY58_02080 [Gammaproteobacteria bacterium CG_4_10_14_0_8_um_filter_38_16]PJA04103.1 MAG: hypothetical protein COX72_01865 [Gammaproteobacteria bacterium CG_4_10_14_0_2_um_filter_38_22]PJB10031.1 MAG: hypothetical protein CO120_07040 [Gammaproteobacteria bacterium CG_4_9_14_3_um_filter_38_9]